MQLLVLAAIIGVPVSALAYGFLELVDELQTAFFTSIPKDLGFDVACTLTQARPGLAVVLISSIDYRQCEALLRDCGARGFVLKSDLACADLAAYWPAPGDNHPIRVSTR